jgi:4-hydroxythreonine-4-phosphate dehydrogenase
MKNQQERPIIAITMGDPVGIGPEIIPKALVRPSIYEVCRPLVIGDVGGITAASHRLNTGLRIHSVDAPEDGIYQHGTIDVIGLSGLDYDHVEHGHPTRETGGAMAAYINQAIDWAMQERVHGLTTCPINKAALHMAGVEFDGHTELLAERTNTSDYVMMLAGRRLRVALVTIHLPLARVAEKLTTDAILKTIQISHDALRGAFGISNPRLAVAGLNPHAGEGGLFGDEEIRIISPAVLKGKETGLDVSGPHPPDACFHWALEGKWDAVVCMYHDQGLIPFKMIHFADGVNVTLGLPIVRTSVDHGTAYDIAGTGRADPGSLIAAISMAADHAIHRAARAGK